MSSDGFANGFSSMPSQQGMPSDGRHWMHGCTNVAGLNHAAMDLIAARKKNYLDLDWNNSKVRTFFRAYKRRGRRVMPDELVWEILLRLPSKTLARFKSVCRGWRAIISSPPFISMHLRQSSSRNEREPSFLIAPHTFCDMTDDKSMPKTCSTDKVPFYHWQWQEEAGQGNAACLVHTMDLNGDSGFAYWPMHCDGLVLLPTDTKLYVFNPGTGDDVLTLPEGQKSRGHGQLAGLGLDLSTNTYKVVHFFYRSVDHSKRTYNAGMEVFTIGGGGSCWRIVDDPPYPVMPQEPFYFKGSLYWHIEREVLQTPLQGFLRFDLKEENFDFISHPVLPSDEQPLEFVELGGKLCLVQPLPAEIVFWTSSPSSGDNHQWHRVYVINNLPMRCKALRCLGDCVFLQSGTIIYRHDKATGITKEVAAVDQLRYKNPKTGDLDFVGKDRYFIFIIPYTESLVPLPGAR